MSGNALSLPFLLNTSCNDVSERCLRTPGCLLMRSQRIFQRSSLCPTSRSTRFQANLSSSSDALFRSSKGLDRVLIFDASWSLQHSCSPCDGNGSVALLLAHRLRHGVKLIFPNVHLRTVFPMRAWLCSHGLASLSQMPHLVLAYAIPLTSTCSCILSQAVRLNGLLVVSRFGRFPGRSTLCFDFCSDVFFGFRSFASVP